VAKLAWGLAACAAVAAVAFWAWRGRVHRGPDVASHAPAVQSASGGPFELADVTQATGIHFVHVDGSSGARYILEPMSCGLALFDYDGDGLIDVYFANGAALEGAQYDKPPRDALYKNLGNVRFQEVTDEAGVGDLNFGLGVTVADYDDDGHPDVFLDNFGPNVLYRNNGNGTFSEVTRKAGLVKPNPNLVGAGTCFLDMDKDGDLDLEVGNYLEFRYEEHVQRMQGGFQSYPSPRDFQPVPDTVYRNNGDGTFIEVSRECGIGGQAGTTMGMVCFDADRDGATDIFVCNDVHANFFWKNDGTGKFREIGILNGTSYNAYGDELASMGADCGDFDNDGWLDLFMTNYEAQLPVLYRNLGNGLFEDVAAATNAGAGCLPYVNWGCGLVDFDNDGDKDIYIANGHTEDNIELRSRTSHYRCQNFVLQNMLMETGQARFENVTDRAGDGLLPVHASRGAGFDDLDNDGRIDVVVLNSRQSPTILRNVTANGNHWLQLQLRGVRTNRDGVGAQVRIQAGDLRLIDEVHSGRSYQSHFGSRLHFGLGKRDRVERIEVRWVGGGVDLLEDVHADQLLTITECGRP